MAKGCKILGLAIFAALIFAVMLWRVGFGPIIQADESARGFQVNVILLGSIPLVVIGGHLVYIARACIPVLFPIVCGLVYILVASVFYTSGQEIVFVQNGQIKTTCVIPPFLGELQAVPVHYVIEAECCPEQPGKIKVRLDFYPDRSLWTQFEPAAIRKIFQTKVEKSLSEVSDVDWKSLDLLKEDLSQVPENLPGNIKVQVTVSV